MKASESDVKLKAIFETDIFSREIKLEPLVDSLFAVKSEPHEELDVIKPDFLPSVCWPLDNEIKPAFKSKKSKLKQKTKVPKPPKQPKQPKPPKIEKSTEEKAKTKCSRYHFVCSLCGQLCRQKSVFEEHMFRHEDSRPFVCHYCNHTFSYKRSLIRHMIIHRDVKLYHCDLCTNSYRNRHNLIYHKINTHGTEDEKKFKCICGKAFAFNYLLKIHATKYCKGPVGSINIQQTIPLRFQPDPISFQLESKPNCLKDNFPG
jgi:Zinc finger, C2H2 type